MGSSSSFTMRSVSTEFEAACLEACRRLRVPRRWGCPPQSPAPGFGKKYWIRLPLPLLRIGWGRFFDRNIWPDFRVFRIQRQPFLKPRLGVGLDRVDRALRLAHPAIDAFVRVDDEHVFALVEAVHGAHFDAVER